MIVERWQVQETFDQVADAAWLRQGVGPQLDLVRVAGSRAEICFWWPALTTVAAEGRAAVRIMQAKDGCVTVGRICAPDQVKGALSIRYLLFTSTRSDGSGVDEGQAK